MNKWVHEFSRFQSAASLFFKIISLGVQWDEVVVESAIYVKESLEVMVKCFAFYTWEPSVFYLLMALLL